jgi:hypothetical protein
MASSTAGSNKISILDQLVTILNEISEYSNNVYSGLRTEKSIKVDKHILIHLTEDRYVAGTLSEDIHTLVFNILVKWRAGLKGDPETQMDTFIDLVGLVEDKLKANYVVPGTWEDLSIRRINYTFGQASGFNYYNALLIVEVRAQW